MQKSDVITVMYRRTRTYIFVITFSLLWSVGTLAQNVPYIHEVIKSDNVNSLQKKYSDFLNGKTLPQLNNHIYKFRLHKSKEVIVNKNVRIGFCKHIVEDGEWLAGIIRLYSYKKPYSLNLVELAKKKNKHLTNINDLKIGETVDIPVVYIGNYNLKINNTKACRDINNFANHNIFGHKKIAKNSNQNIKRYVSSELTSENKHAEEKKIDSTPSFHPGSEVVISMGAIYDSLHGENESSVIVSKLHPSVNLEWKQHWTPGWSSLLGARSLAKVYHNDTVSDETLNNRKMSLNSIYAGLEYNFLNNLNLRTKFGLDEDLYYKPDGASSYTLSKDQAFFFEGQISKKLIEIEMLSAGALLLARARLAGANGFEGGYDYGAGIQIRHNLKGAYLNGKIIYHQGIMESEFSEFEHRWLELIISYGFGF